MHRAPRRLTRRRLDARGRAMPSAPAALCLIAPRPSATPAHRPTGFGQLPDPRPWTWWLAQALAEVLAGARPAIQVAALVTLDVRRLLERRSGRFGAGPGRPPQRPIVTSVRVTEPADGIVEACAVVATGARRRVIAMRLDAVEGQWRCTALRVG
jgi:hypothetical protein